MRVLLLSIMAFGFSASGAVLDNPWQDTCVSEEGRFAVLKNGKDEFSVCFFGDNAIGASSLYLLKGENKSTEALSAYKQRRTSSPRGGVCGAFDSELVIGKNPQGESFHFCKFPDDSIVEETTLWLGPKGSTNDQLDEVLSRL